MNTLSWTAALGAAVVVGCASGGARAHDPWLGSRQASDCTQPSCLFAVVTDSSGNPLAGADVELSGTSIRTTTNNSGRLAIQGIPLGSHRVRLFADGAPIESAPLAFGLTMLAVTIQVRADTVLIRP